MGVKLRKTGKRSKKEEQKQVGEKSYLFKPYGGTSSSIEIQGNKITGGSFEAGKEDTYPLGDQEVPLPEGSKASFDDGKWKIEIPAEGVIDIPKSGGNTPIEYSKKGIEDLLKIYMKFQNKQILKPKKIKI